jgi:hypothetical protein
VCICHTIQGGGVCNAYSAVGGRVVKGRRREFGTGSRSRERNVTSS